MGLEQLQVELQEFMGSDKSICDAAWTSTYNKDRRVAKYDDDKKIQDLVFRMAKDGHSTPFESVSFRFWFRWPIFTDRQHVTHRIASHNGLSGRYRTLPDDWYRLPDDILGILAKFDEKQGINMSYEWHMKQQQEFYSHVLDRCRSAEKDQKITNGEYKRVREVIRGVIGTSSMVERVSIFNLRSFANYQRLRNTDHAQKEIHEIAERMLFEVEKERICPSAIQALKEVGWRI